MVVMNPNFFQQNAQRFCLAQPVLVKAAQAPWSLTIHCHLPSTSLLFVKHQIDDITLYHTVFPIQTLPQNESTSTMVSVVSDLSEYTGIMPRVSCETDPYPEFVEL
ncbi:hypothetical protein chiPu_0009955 [Chiloscyllium punctatum]|uniref:Uncharacterized protein n=1 Tax=Chiloscyllium punctatum TaxID=137246 RepID=A0A401SM72_CHIPU|nr:hypothetical protein [Chiloscyllium punctatum]